MVWLEAPETLARVVPLEAKDFGVLRATLDLRDRWVLSAIRASRELREPPEHQVYGVAVHVFAKLLKLLVDKCDKVPPTIIIIISKNLQRAYFS